jgi:RNA polymerase sigma-70 factor (ECF subfamily)
MTEPDPLDRHRPALLAWAQARMPDRVRSKLDPADLVHQTFLDALRGRERFAGWPDHKVLAYLRKALTNNVIDAARKFPPGRGDVSADAAAESGSLLTVWLEAPDTSPSERAGRNERYARLADGLAGLPEAQRVAVELRYLQGLKVTEIAGLLGRSEGAVSQLLHRAVLALRDTFGHPGEIE